MVLHFKVRQFFQQQRIENNFYIEGVNLTTGHALPIAQSFVDEAAATLAPVMAGQWTLEEILYRDAGAAPGTPFITLPVTGTPLQGADGGNSTITQATATLAFQSTEGPPWRGYMAWGGLPASAIASNGDVTLSFRGDLEDFWQDFTDSLPAIYSLARPVIYSRGTATYPAGTFAEITSHVARQFPSTRATRKKGRGS